MAAADTITMSVVQSLEQDASREHLDDVEGSVDDVRRAEALLGEAAPEMAPEASDAEEDANSLYEAFANLSIEELKMMGGRLIKCHDGFQEMLQEAHSEREQLQQDTADLNQQIEFAMHEIHEKEIAKAARAKARKPENIVAQVAPMALKVGAAWQNLNQHVGNVNKEVWGQQLNSWRHQVAQNTKDMVKTGTFNLLNMKALLNTTDSAADREKQKQAARAQRQAARRKAREEARKQAEAEADDAETIALGDKAVEKKRVVQKPAIAPPVIVAREPPAVIKRKPIVMMTTTMVIEAKIEITDGTVHSLEVAMTDSCEEAARKFILEHNQRQWFEKPLTAWLKKAEAEATKLPFRIEASLAELRKQHNNAQASA